MPHGHSHGHSHDHSSTQKKADNWTKMATVGEAVSSLISDAFWLGTWFDLVSGFEGEAIGISYYAMTFGLIGALLSASGAAYCHQNLNTVHQTELQPHEDDDEISGHTHKHAHAHDEEDKETTALMPPNKHLSRLQKLALVGDAISHTGDVAGPLTFVFNLATKNNLPRWGNILVQCGSTLFGAASTVANVRTCKNALLNTQETRPEHSLS